MRVFNTFCFLLFLCSITHGQLTDQPKAEKVIYRYLDSNLRIENLFPEDTLYKDLKISFVKKKLFMKLEIPILMYVKFTIILKRN